MIHDFLFLINSLTGNSNEFQQTCFLPDISYLNQKTFMLWVGRLNRKDRYDTGPDDVQKTQY